MQMRTFIFVLASFVSLANFAHADVETPKDFYTIDNETASAAAELNHADAFIMDTFSVQMMAAQMRDVAISLLSWTLHPQASVQPQDLYNRKFHFGRWINDPTDETCYNTRAKVLLRDANGEVSYRERNRCVVDRGAWADPYTGRTFTESRDIQIDHMVPLKDAYDSGAWQWDYQTRCLYANFMGNDFHLISSNGIENMRKGDRAPDGYMPPNQEYQCQYLENWLKIKLIWKLNMTPEEVAAIHEVVETHRCDTSAFELSEKELRKQRSLIRTNLGLCPAR